MKKYLPKSLAGQLIAVLLLALVVAQVTSLIILHDDRRLAFLFSAERDALTRTVAVTRLLNKSDPAMHAIIVEAASGGRLLFELSGQSAVAARGNKDDDDDEGFQRFLKFSLARELDDDVREVQVAVRKHDDDDDNDDEDDDDDKYGDDSKKRWQDRDGRSGSWFGTGFRNWREGHHRRNQFRPRRSGPILDITISLALPVSSGSPGWLNVQNRVPPTGPAIAIPSLVTIAIMAVLLVIVVIFMVRRVTRPLAQLADSAERLGRGEDVAYLKEQGPQDIRQASRAFNQMQERLTRFVRDRTLMLAAIAHDLRTPITSLRIRAEMIEDGENRDRILETLEEMQALTEAALEFARQEAESEETRNVDLIALVKSVCADLQDMEQDVLFASEIPRLPHSCHPMALKRVVRNLVENAVRYGDQARVGINVTGGNIEITVEDNGPGVSPEDRERIFEPFVRLEDSRNRETGGIGLGLAIAHTIIRQLGGDILVGSSDTGGARFTIRLPQ